MCPLYVWRYDIKDFLVQLVCLRKISYYIYLKFVSNRNLQLEKVHRTFGYSILNSSEVVKKHLRRSVIGGWRWCVFVWLRTQQWRADCCERGISCCNFFLILAKKYTVVLLPWPPFISVLKYFVDWSFGITSSGWKNTLLFFNHERRFHIHKSKNS